jgi:hypothetical protein
VEAQDWLGKPHRLRGVGGNADLLRSCELRYVLDAEASRQCADLVRADNGLLEPDSDLLRLPGELFWIEWIGETATASERPHRIGALVEASLDGRRGIISGYRCAADGQPDANVAIIQFDLDRPLPRPKADEPSAPIQHGTLSHLNGLLRHALLHIDPSWMPLVMSNGRAGLRQRLYELGNASWFNLPFVLAFSAMLNSRDVVEQHPSDLARLNAARARRGRPALLEHVEVRLALNARQTGGSVGHGEAVRAAPRLHHVRGHLVQRRGRTFWRSSHLRGDQSGPPVKKTVLVSAGAKPKKSPDSHQRSCASTGHPHVASPPRISSAGDGAGGPGGPGGGAAFRQAPAVPERIESGPSGEAAGTRREASSEAGHAASP